MGEKDFSKIPNGHPAIENRMELLYSEGVAKGKITLNKYVLRLRVLIRQKYLECFHAKEL